MAHVHQIDTHELDSNDTCTTDSNGRRTATQNISFENPAKHFDSSNDISWILWLI